MSERRDLRKKHTGKGKEINRSRAPRASPSTIHQRRIRAAGGIKWRRKSKLLLLTRTNSEPWLWKPGGDESAAAAAEDVGVLYRPRTCADIFSSPGHPSPSNHSHRYKYKNDTKVVIDVTVEGSPGAIRSMVRLGSTVGEITKLVVDKYNEEGRTPPIHKRAFSSYQLHHSYFSLEGLSQSDLIGDVGSRSFYLRRRDSNSDDNSSAGSSNQPESWPLPFLPMLVNRKIKKVMRRTRKFWKILGCIPLPCDR